MSEKDLSTPDRRQFNDSLTRQAVEGLVSNSALQVLQCSSPVSNATWDLLNSSFFTRRPDVQLRVYGFYGKVCDLSFLTRMQNVRRLSADCLMQATGVEHLVELDKLETLAIGISDLKDFEFLSKVPKNLRELSLEGTKSKKPRLRLLERFDSLVALYLDGQQNDIEVLAQLETLEDLTLRSISTSDLSYLKSLKQLWSLDIKLGGIADLSAIENKSSIKYLELWQIRGLNDIGVVSSLTGLQFLFLQSLRHVRRIPDLARLSHLRRIWLENMKGLEDISALASAPSLEEFAHTTALNCQLFQYEQLLSHPRLRRMFVGFGSERKHRALESKMSQAGIEKYSHEEFVFR